MSIKHDTINNILKEVIALPPEWHACGSLRPSVLKAIFRHCSKLSITHSLETGSGKSTILFSHISPDHKVFTLDEGNGSIEKVKKSPLFKNESTVFIEGPTQITLAKFNFSYKLQVALLDGPHGYPFPDLEYYYIYPHLEKGSILIIDDIDIPSVHNMFKFLKSDKMFSLIEVVKTTAFFRRTDAPIFNPLADGWWLQDYNKRKLRRMVVTNYLSRILPIPIRNLLRRIIVE